MKSLVYASPDEVLVARITVVACDIREMPGYLLIFDSPSAGGEKKSNELKSGERGSQATGSPHPIHCTESVSFKKFRTLMEKWAGDQSCINHMLLWMGNGAVCNKLGSTCSK
ncbi:hypothetical protein TNCV_3592661 [Trichonephila clavipes]|nr:hypothetical protein TNCV_3592661 [Trichonephila clavipes]